MPMGKLEFQSAKEKKKRKKRQSKSVSEKGYENFTNVKKDTHGEVKLSEAKTLTLMTNKAMEAVKRGRVMVNGDGVKGYTAEEEKNKNKIKTENKESSIQEIESTKKKRQRNDDNNKH